MDDRVGNDPYKERQESGEEEREKRGGRGKTKNMEWIKEEVREKRDGKGEENEKRPWEERREKREGEGFKEKTSVRKKKFGFYSDFIQQESEAISYLADSPKHVSA